MDLFKYRLRFIGAGVLLMTGMLLPPQLWAQSPAENAAKKENLGRIRLGAGVEYGHRAGISGYERQNNGILLGSLHVRIPVFAFPKNPVVRSLEAIPQVVGGSLLAPAGFVAGFDAVGRFNLHPLGVMRPFADIGAGITAIHRGNRAEVAGVEQFSLLFRFGVERQLSKNSRRTFEVSAGVRHNSNKGIAHPNRDFNAFTVRTAFNF